MALKTHYQCTSCGFQSIKWFGLCPSCGQWNSAEQSTDLQDSSMSSSRKVTPSPTISLPDYPHDEIPITASGITELDRVLGGGIIPSTVVLVGGYPGIGKSTLMLQMAAAMASKTSVVYLSGEETAERIKQRAQRLDCAQSPINVICDTSLDAALLSLKKLKPRLVIVDSVQALRLSQSPGIPGSISQVRNSAQLLTDFSREYKSSVFLVTHITKGGELAGPKLLEHLVDTVLFFDHSGSELRFLRVTKNRFGTTDELGLFTMNAKGLSALHNPSHFFIFDRNNRPNPPGVVSVPIYEGSRVFLVELQALTVASPAPHARIYSDRIDARRISRIAAVLEKHLGLQLSDHDIYINVAGGMIIKDVGIDVPLALALYSARKEEPLPSRISAMGELSLAAELRPVPFLRQRIKAAQDMGFEMCLGAPLSDTHQNLPGYHEATTLNDVIEIIREYPKK